MSQPSERSVLVVGRAVAARFMVHEHVLAAALRLAAYPDDFMRRIEGMKFRQEGTNNRVLFVSLPQERQQRIYEKYRASMAQREEAERARRRKRPTFAKAKEAVFDKLDESGWETRRGLKVPKAVKTVGDNQVILHFKPQAVWMEVRGQEKVPARSLHVDLRDVANDPAAWIEGLGKNAEDAVKMEAEMNAPYRKANFTMKSIDDWKTIGDRNLRTAAYSQEFLDWARDRMFRNDETGNRVRFDQMPASERDRLHDGWEDSRADREGHGMWEDAGPSDGLMQMFRTRFDEGDLSEDDRVYNGQQMFDDVLEELCYGECSPFRGGSPDLDTDDDDAHGAARKLYDGARRWTHLIVDRMEDERKGLAPPRVASLATWRTVGEGHVGSDDGDGMGGWSFLPEGREAFVVPPTGMAPPMREREPGVPQMKIVRVPAGLPGGIDPEAPEPPPPAEIKRQLSERMRDLGRTLMISGMRAPRQQMIEIGRALDALIDQLELLADQPGRQALKRRILLGLRQRVLSGK